MESLTEAYTYLMKTMSKHSQGYTWTKWNWYSSQHRYIDPLKGSIETGGHIDQMKLMSGQN